MRTNLPETLRRRGRTRDGRHPRPSIAAPLKRAAASPGPATEAAVPSAAADPAVERAREAGGPHDEAAYACPCGFVFRAPVSTTVACPHCQATQAW